MASQYDININIDVQSATLGELEDELKRINDEIKKIPPNSKDFNKAASNVKQLSGEVDKANKKLQSVDVGQLVGDFAKVGAAVGAVGAAFAAFGEEGSATNEQLQKALQRTQAVLALVAVAEAAVSAARLASAAATSLQTVAQNAFNAAVNSGIISLKGLKTALAATGIGLLVVALGLVVAYFDDIKNFVTGGDTTKLTKDIENQEKALEKLNAQYDRLLAITENNRLAGQDEVENLKDRLNILRDYNAKSEAAINQSLQNYDKLLLAQGELTEEQIKGRAALLILLEENKGKVLAAEKALNDARLKELDDNNRDEIALLQAQGKETFAAQKENLQERLTLLKSFGAAYADEVKATEKEITRIVAEEETKRRKERRDRIKSELGELADIIETDPAEALRVLADEQERALAILEKYSGGSKDITEIVKALRKDGLEPLANQFERLADPENYNNFSQIIAKFFQDRQAELVQISSDRVLDFNQFTIQQQQILDKAFTDNFTKIRTLLIRQIDDIRYETGTAYVKLREETISYLFDIDQAIQSQAQIAGFGINQIIGTVFEELSPEQSIAALDKIYGELSAQAIKAFNERKTAIIQEFAKIGELTDEQEKLKAEQINTLVTNLNAGLTQLETDYTTAVNTLFTGILTRLNIENQKVVRDLNEKLNLLETRYVGFQGFLKSLGDDILQEERELQTELLNAEETRIEKERELLEQQYAQGLIDRADYLQKLEDLEDQAAQVRAQRRQQEADEEQQRLENILLFYELARDLTSAILDNITATAERQVALLDVEIAARERSLQLQLEGITNEEQRLQVQQQGEAQIAALKAEQVRIQADAAKKQANITFALAIGEIAVNTANAIMKAFAQLGPVAGGIAAAGIATLGAFQITAANRARQAAIAGADASLAGLGDLEIDQRSQFAEGGLVTGPGTGTSDSIAARLSNGEYVVNAASTRQFLPVLEQINNAPQRFANGGMVSNGGSDPAMMALLARIEQRLATPPRAYVVTSDIQQGINTEQYLQRRSQLT